MWGYLFIPMAVALYGAMHLYAYRHLVTALSPSWRERALLVVFFLLMSLPLFGHHLLDRWAEHQGWIRIWGTAGYFWMAILFWFCVLAVGLDAWNGLVSLGRRIRPEVNRLKVPPRAAMATIGFVILIGLGYGLWEASRVRVQEIRIQTPVLASTDPPIRIVQIADLHLGTSSGPRTLPTVVTLIQALDPDLIVSTGDLVDSSFQNLQRQAQILATLLPRLGKYAVLGNHEYYAGLQESLAFHHAAGFRVLREQSVLCGPGLHLAGVDDPAGHYTRHPSFTNETGLVLPGQGQGFGILLKHQPRVSDSALGHFDLQLAGHTHGGQIFPFHAVVRLIYPVARGLHKFNARFRLYVSSGAGTWGPPLRVGAPPEITLFILEPARTSD